jgi:site-specific DNA-methyltransferase (adenine-specific)
MSDTRIIHADCLDAMRAMPEASVTAIVTDPPYGLEFMGKGWDKVLPPVDVWREALRVLKPGGHALVFGGTRTFHRLAVSLEDAGLEIRDCLMWLYGQGFPKSLDVSKAIDKAAGAEREVLGVDEKKRAQQTAKSDNTRLGTFAGSAGLISASASELSRTWEGYGTALKPAWEPILLARKPLIGTVERNCREHGTGALNIDGCRIGSSIIYSSGGFPEITNRPPREGREEPDGRAWARSGAGVGAREVPGRWPANLVLDEAAAELLDAQAPDKGQAAPLTTRHSDKLGKNAYGSMGGDEAADFMPHDAPGGASRFFYCAKASKSDRGEFNNHATVKPVELMRWLVRLVKGPGDNLILDPFAGSGTTGVAAALEGVPCVLIEREAQYVEIIRRRLQETP